MRPKFKSLLPALFAACLVFTPAFSQLHPAILSWSGVINTDSMAAIPALLSQTGFDSTNTALFHHYDVNLPQFRDLTHMDHWIYVPAGQTITVSDSSDWHFPLGTVLFRKISHDSVWGDPSTRLNIEFQIQIRRDTAWAGLVYIYNGADAELLTPAYGGMGFALKYFTMTLTGSGYDYYNKADPSAPVPTVTNAFFRMPSDCNSCHWNSHANGFFTQQLNKGTQLQDLQAAGIINAVPDLAGMAAVGKITEWYPLDHPTATTFQKIRSYLSANCSNCHIHEYHMTGKTTAYSYFTEVAEQSWIDSLWEVIKPGKPRPDSSDLVNRLIKADMPLNGGSARSDAKFAKIVWDWIDAMDGSPGDYPNMKISLENQLAVKKVQVESSSFPTAALHDQRVRFSYPVPVNEAVELFNIRGEKIELLKISSTEYAVTGPLHSGLYVVRAGSRTMPLIYSRF